MWLPYAVRVSEHNPNVPDNLYLMIGGPFGDCLQWFDEAAENNICAVFKDMVRASASSVKVIFETDGDLAMSGYTRIALRCSAGIFVPMEVDDFVGYKRLATLCEELQSTNNGIPAGQPACARVQAVCWNKVPIHKWAPCLETASIFTPPKAFQEVISAFNELLYSTAVSNPDGFVHPPTQGAVDSVQCFTANSTCCIPVIDTIHVASIDASAPFCRMQPGPLQGRQLPRPYTIVKEQVEHCVEVIQGLVDKM